MFVVTAEKSEKKAPEKGILLVTHSAQSFFPTTFLSGIFSLFNEKFEPFWKKRPGQTTSGGHSDFSFDISSIGRSLSEVADGVPAQPFAGFQRTLPYILDFWDKTWREWGLEGKVGSFQN